jgi:hypothetical protein
MLDHTNKHPTEKLLPLHLMVHPANVARITNYVKTLESSSDSSPWREVAGQRGNVLHRLCVAHVAKKR